MPLVNVKLMDGVFSSQRKHAMAAALPDVMMKFEGSEAFREVAGVLIEELHTGGRHIGGRPFMGPKSIMETLGRSKDVFESIDGRYRCTALPRTGTTTPTTTPTRSPARCSG